MEGYTAACNIIWRCSIMLVLCFSIDLPHGVAPMGTLGREMGISVLGREFLDPSIRVLTWRAGASKMTAGSDAYRCMLTCVFVIGVPAYVLVTIVLSLVLDLSGNVNQKIN